MVFLAVLSGALTAILRIRRFPLDGSLLAKGMIVAVVVGWLFSRAGLWLDGTARDAGVRVLSPLYNAPGSLTYFLMGVCAGLTGFAAFTGRTAINYMDALAPSTFVALVFAKIGCLLGGCCAGGVCPPALGISYPYGTPAYEHQYRTGAITVPAELIKPGDPNGGTALWGDIQIMTLQPGFLADRVADAGLPRDSANAIAEAARQQHSLPVWPVPVVVSVASFALWIAAEIVFRKSKRPGATVAFVFASYGLLRLAFDWFIAQRGPLYIGMTVAQWVGLCALLLGAAIYARIAMRSRPAH